MVKESSLFCFSPPPLSIICFISPFSCRPFAVNSLSLRLNLSIMGIGSTNFQRRKNIADFFRPYTAGKRTFIPDWKMIFPFIPLIFCADIFCVWLQRHQRPPLSLASMTESKKERRHTTSSQEGRPPTHTTTNMPFRGKGGLRNDQ